MIPRDSGFRFGDLVQDCFVKGFKEMVNHPNHYKGKSGMEAIDVIEEFELGFNLGNAIKYVLRSKRKDDVIQDLRKAIWYIRREINNICAEMENDGEEDC